MTVEILLFAGMRQVVGERSVSVEVDENATVGQVLEVVVGRCPSLREALARVGVAVNQKYVNRDHVVREGDEVALIPPVSGGVGDRD